MLPYGCHLGQPWAGIGLDPLGGQVLEHLVGLPSADAATITEAAGTSTPQAEETLRRLEDARLVTRVGGRPARWAASPPRSEHCWHAGGANRPSPRGSWSGCTRRTRRCRARVLRIWWSSSTTRRRWRHATTRC
ncbi:helix-turn-helix domain-containing protein [Streptomyces sp. NPDC056821]|uniref:helix-turn-helix domain-containing protein n=1 Tax=Streptomyces sp. NPDC056821 TaxID=3345952 RepID=UPI0036C8EF39